MKIRITKKGLPKAQWLNSQISVGQMVNQGITDAKNMKRPNYMLANSFNPMPTPASPPQFINPQSVVNKEPLPDMGGSYTWKNFNTGIVPTPRYEVFNQDGSKEQIGNFGEAKTVFKTVGADDRPTISDFKIPNPDSNRNTMYNIGKTSDTVRMGIGLGSAATDFFINNPAIKKENKERQINQGLTDYLFMAGSKDRGDYVAAGSRIGELRPDQYVTNKGMYTGQFMPSMNTMQFGGTGMIDDENPLPMPMMQSSNLQMPESANNVSPVENTTPSDFKISSNFENYAIKADRYIRSVNPKTDISGEMLAIGAQLAFEKTGKIVPVELALAQLQQEGYLAKGSKLNKPQRTKNPFNVGNTDNGSVVSHSNLQNGINSYYDLLTTKYLNKKNPEQLLQNFVNGAGNRYASDQNYENSLKQIINQVQKTTFEVGGVYELSEDEIKSILSFGGDVEFI